MYKNNNQICTAGLGAGLGVSPWIVTAATNVVKNVINSIFGGGESPEEEHNRWIRDWERDMDQTQWVWFANWMQERFEKNDWDDWWVSHCDSSKVYYKHETPGYNQQVDLWGMIQRVAADITDIEYGVHSGNLVPHCRSNWRTWDPKDEPSIPDQTGPSIVTIPGETKLAGYGGLLTVLLVGVGATLLFTKKKR